MDCLSKIKRSFANILKLTGERNMKTETSISLPVLDSSGKAVTEIRLNYIWRKSVGGLDLMTVCDKNGKHLMMRMSVAGSGITHEKNGYMPDCPTISGAYITVEVEGRSICIPKYLSFLTEVALEA
jgi:hypothetical protein